LAVPVRAILRNQPLREKSVLTAKALRHIFLSADGVTARIFRMMNTLAIAASKTASKKSRMKRFSPGHP
jgi:hypothetical protein